MTLAKTGQKANLPDQKTTTPTQTAATTPQTTCSDGEPDYVPQVGDEVVFKWNGKLQKGLIYHSEEYSKTVAVIHVEIGNTDSRFMYCRANYEAYIGMRKVSHTNSVSSMAVDFDTASEFAKAYFAKAFTPDPGKSYAENQAAWVEFHGLKKGSEVKVISTNTHNERGSQTPSHRLDDINDYGPFGTIREINQGNIKLNMRDSIFFDMPYFCLEPAVK